MSKLAIFNAPPTTSIGVDLISIFSCEFYLLVIRCLNLFSRCNIANLRYIYLFRRANKVCSLQFSATENCRNQNTILKNASLMKHSLYMFNR